MYYKILVILSVGLVLSCVGFAGSGGGSSSGDFVELARFEDQYSSVLITPAKFDGQYGLVAEFQGTADMHYYADSPTSPSPELSLKVKADSDLFAFAKSIFPAKQSFIDPFGKKVDVHGGNFKVFVPVKSGDSIQEQSGVVDVSISGLACTSKICLVPFVKTIQVPVDFGDRDLWPVVTDISLTENPGDAADSAGQRRALTGVVALLFAFLAGLSLNIMPCVWPVLPIIVMRIVEQSKESRNKSIVMGMAFCVGILLFFGVLAAANIILQLFYGTVLQWGDQFRNPTFVAGMAMLLVVLALFMFGLFNVAVPSSIASKSSSGKGLGGAVGMGFLAAILSTPCSFAILAAAFAWAQTQPLPLATLAIMIIGVGMAAPYVVLTSVPGLLKHVPKPGKWMELFKQGIGFLLLIIAVKLISAVPAVSRTGVLYFAVVLSFCTWMWGSWVDYSSSSARRWVVRIAAIALALIGGRVLLSGPSGETIDWQKYDAELIESSRSQDRLVLIKFTADWCLSCQVVEKTVYGRGDIIALIREKDVVAIKGDTTVRDYAATLALKNIYKEPGVPVSVLFLPGKSESLRWRGLTFGDKLKAALEGAGSAE